MIKDIRYLFFIIPTLFIFVFTSSFAQLTVNAGPDKIVCPGASVTLGSISPASGGLAPYTY
ncbi:MAG: hypothetical protein NTX97_05285, partial [Bacteroidetes bacterium]|nr:hypothetical protein [Bacteroidota bacterium]